MYPNFDLESNRLALTGPNQFAISTLLFAKLILVSGLGPDLMTPMVHGLADHFPNISHLSVVLAHQSSTTIAGLVMPLLTRWHAKLRVLKMRCKLDEELAYSFALQQFMPTRSTLTYREMEVMRKQASVTNFVSLFNFLNSVSETNPT